MKLTKPFVFWIMPVQDDMLAVQVHVSQTELDRNTDHAGMLAEKVLDALHQVGIRDVERISDV
jgi:hypothetical protein